MDTVLFCCSLVACFIGVLTFVSALNARAKNDSKDTGVVVQKIDQALEGIEDLKSDVKALTSGQQSLALVVNSHEEQIKALSKTVCDLETHTQALVAILEALKHIDSKLP